MINREHGVIVTYVDSFERIEDCVRRGGYNVVKVITGWGIDGGWHTERKKRLATLVPHLIVRSVTGDPSAGSPGANPFPDPNTLEQEMGEWYAIKSDIAIEIGNEPNIEKNTPDDFFWKYNYNLVESVKRCRQVFPRARLISPAPIIGPDYRAERFWEICKEGIDTCDCVGIHVYEYYGFHEAQRPASTNQLNEAIAICSRLYGGKQWYITEYGINDSKEVSIAEKGRRYARFIHFNESTPELPGNLKGAVYYHLAMKGDLHPEYHIYPEGDDSFSATRDMPVSFGVPAAQPATPAPRPAPAPAAAQTVLSDSGDLVVVIIQSSGALLRLSLQALTMPLLLLPKEPQRHSRRAAGEFAMSALLVPRELSDIAIDFIDRVEHGDPNPLGLPDKKEIAYRVDALSTAGVRGVENAFGLLTRMINRASDSVDELAQALDELSGPPAA